MNQGVLDLVSVLAISLAVVFAAAVLISSCNTSVTLSAGTEDKMKCEAIAHRITRCIYEDEVCYKFSRDISCFKR